ncbi:hypothetical protein WHR41_05100 [Cladosporium halotolerans]|uniref:CREG-like beta-barrel domain-containing protein n=1 Tax=Cladosporium halotolerans TaxID=1052096 RepID=A0AB34KM26_9PEZI
MRTSLALSSLLSVTSALSIVFAPERHHVFSNPPLEEQYYKIPSIHESAVMARRILHLASEGTLVTSFPEKDTKSNMAEQDVEALWGLPAGLDGSPIGLMEYIGDCEDDGNPTILAIDIATPFRNYKAGSNISLSVRWWPTQTHTYSFLEDKRADAQDIPTPHTPAALPRFSLHGHLEDLNMKDFRNARVAACFVRKHPDSVLWQPGNDVHSSKYVRFVVEEVFWFGGFGDRARIGWLPVEEWRNVTKQEIDELRLPGEKKQKAAWWKQWL